MTLAQRMSLAICSILVVGIAGCGGSNESQNASESNRPVHSIEEWSNILQNMTKEQVVNLLGTPDGYQQNVDQPSQMIIWERFTYRSVVESKYAEAPDTLYVDFQYDHARSLSTGSGGIVQLF